MASEPQIVDGTKSFQKVMGGEPETSQSQVLLFHCRRLAGLLGQLVATLSGFGGAACSYFDDFDPFIDDLDGYS